MNLKQPILEKFIVVSIARGKHKMPNDLRRVTKTNLVSALCVIKNSYRCKSGVLAEVPARTNVGRFIEMPGQKTIEKLLNT
jgi:hypothetical protein